MNARIGFCCKFLETGPKAPVLVPGLNGRGTTMRWLREHPQLAEQRQWELMDHNTSAILRLVERVGSMPPHLRMVRLGSDILAGYTESSWQAWWQRTEIQQHCAEIFAPIGRRARELDVRLSFHPGQFCVLGSDNDDIVDRSIEDFEYHTTMARWMGYGSSWHDQGFKINVHLSGRGGQSKFLQSLGRLSPEARNLITIENDEITNGLDITLDVAGHVALVLDIHHHFIKTGEYIQPQDQRIQRIIESWRGIRPVLHYSVSREDLLVDHDPGTLPDLAVLVAGGHRRSKLRAHSDYYWNHAVNDWAMTHRSWADIQCESKMKNLARDQLAAKFMP